jgi:hypothetical protein
MFIITQVYPPAGVIFTGIGILLSVSIIFGFICVSLPDIRLSHRQAAKAVSDGQGALAEVFERIENFFRRIETYIEVPPTTGMTDMIVKIMIEVLSILAITTKEIEQSRASEFNPGGMNSHRRLTIV